MSAPGFRRRRMLLLVVLLLGSFQAGRRAERLAWPCRLRPALSLVAPLLPSPLPDQGVCELLRWLPG